MEWSSYADGDMTRGVKKALVLVVGWAFILLGIAGLFLPVLQGILFLMIGLIILSTEYAWAPHLLGKVRARFPKVAEAADHAKAKAEHWLRRIHGEEDIP